MVKQTEEEFISHFREQIEFLTRSASAYDDGFESEAKRMAVVLRVLLHDTDSSKSLLKHLGRKDILFYDTASDLVPGNLLPEATLIITQIRTGPGGGGSYVAPLDESFTVSLRGDKKLPFDDWWNKKVVKDQKNRVMTRKDIITNVCNKDGGAHLDEKLNGVYSDLTRNNSYGHRYFSKDSQGNILRDEDIKGAELASVRQITHEVLKSFRDEFLEYSELYDQYFQNLKPLLP
jgi:hypothetical protein